MKAMAALFNMETVPGKDMLKKYGELGKAMAKNFGRVEKSE